MNNLKEWAKREIELATIDESDEVKKYYDVAYLAFCDFVDRTTNLDDSEIVKAIFIQLFNECNLTPIEDKPEEWTLVSENGSIYQSNRRPSLYKKLVFKEDEAESFVYYSDQKRSVCIDLDTNKYYEGGIGIAVLNEMYPIKMPYQPIGIIKVITEEFCYHESEKRGPDTIGVLYFKMPTGQMINVMRFFKINKETNETVEINKTEYFARKHKKEQHSRKCSFKI